MESCTILYCVRFAFSLQYTAFHKVSDRRKTCAVLLLLELQIGVEKYHSSFYPSLCEALYRAVKIKHYISRNTTQLLNVS